MNKSLKFISLFYFVFIFNGAYASDNIIRTIYITIDDGPLLGFDNVIAVLDEEKIPATLFLVGEHILASSTHKQDLKNAINSIYIEVGNHSYSHAHEHYQHFYSSSSSVIEDLEKNNRILSINKEPFYSRLPGRNVFRTPKLKTEDPYITVKEDDREKIDFDALYENKFWLYGWDLEWAHETDGKPVQSVTKLVNEIETMFTNQKTQIANNLILLMHDQMFAEHLNGKENFSNLIKALKSAGYQFKFIRDYPVYN